jgi:hypothetical protein
MKYYISKYNVSDYDEDGFLKEGASAEMWDEYETLLLDWKNDGSSCFDDYRGALIIAEDMLAHGDGKYKVYIDNGKGGDWEVTLPTKKRQTMTLEQLKAAYATHLKDIEEEKKAEELAEYEELKEYFKDL